VLATNIPLDALVLPPGVLAHAPEALRRAYGAMRVARIDLERPAFRSRIGIVGDLAFTRGEGRGHIDLNWDDPDRSIRALHHWLIFFSSGLAQTPDDVPSLTIREVALFDGAAWPDRLHLSGSTRNIAVLIPSHQVPPGLVLGTPVASDHGSGAVLAAMARAFEFQSSSTPDPGLADAIPAFMQLLALTFSGAYAKRTEPVRPNHLGRVIDHLELHLDDSDLSPRSVALACGCSVRQLHRLFAPTGESFSQTVRRLRIERVCHLLRSTDRPVGDIAASCGFADAGYMATVFRRGLGMSPGDWRRLGRSATAGGGSEPQPASDSPAR
jgi:AraC-like DNA-binding protein